MAEIFSEPCIRAERDRGSGVIHFVRTEEPYPSLSEVVAAHARLGRVLDRLGREKHVLFVDLRRAVMNNDPGFEKAAEAARRILVRGFPRVAVLVATAVGALQVKRHIREDGREIGVFTSEAEARAFLGEVETPPSSGVAAASERPRSRPADGEGTPSSARARPILDGPFQNLAPRSGRR